MVGVCSLMDRLVCCDGGGRDQDRQKSVHWRRHNIWVSVYRCINCYSVPILSVPISYRSMYVSIPSDSKVTCVKLVIRGHELCEYDYQYVLQQDTLKSKLGQRKARKDLLRIEMKLAEYLG